MLQVSKLIPAGKGLAPVLLKRAATVELDDRPGPARDRLVASQRDWLATLSQAVRIAIEEGHFRRDVDAEQLAFELYAIGHGYHTLTRLLRDATAEKRARQAFEHVLAAARTSVSPVPR